MLSIKLGEATLDLLTISLGREDFGDDLADGRGRGHDGAALDDDPLVAGQVERLEASDAHAHDSRAAAIESGSLYGLGRVAR